MTSAEIGAIPVEWPLEERRWPPPWADGKRSLESEVSEAYGRLAARARRVSTITAQVLFVVGGAWLGVSLPDIWTDYRQSSAEATRALQADDVGFLMGVSWRGFTHLLPAALVAIGVLVLVMARAYEEVEASYKEAAAADAPTTLDPTTSQSSVRRILRQVLRG